MSKHLLLVTYALKDILHYSSASYLLQILQPKGTAAGKNILQLFSNTDILRLFQSEKGMVTTKIQVKRRWLT